MKRKGCAVLLVLAAAVAAGGLEAAAQTKFKMAFPFEAGGKSFSSGEYTVTPGSDGQIVLRREATGKDVAIPVKEKIVPAVPDAEGPRLVFHMVGDFKPSYTEYVTIYILAEVWLPGQDGLRTHVTKGAHKLVTIKPMEEK